ncbi:MAG TPA: hypothetical protein VGK84_07735, partial [Candidatus Tumulicola sp.]
PGSLQNASSSLWNVVSSPNVPPPYGVYDDTLNAVGGSSAKDVWAVGDDCCYPHGTQEYDHALITHWNGSAWSIVPAAKNAPEDTQLKGVSALSPSDAWAVGTAPFPNNQAVLEHWNGKKWNAVPSPQIANGGAMLSVVMLAKNNVWAAGYGNFSAVLEHWDGYTWTFIPAYTQGNTVLNSISASGPNDIWAVGTNLDPALSLFTEHFDGHQWTYYFSAGKFYAATFRSVTTISPKDAWAVGYESAQDQPVQTLAEHWNGGTWNLVSSPNRDPKGSPILTNQLNAVAARSAKDVTAVGVWTWYPGSGTTRSLFEHFDGRKWSLEDGPASLESSNNNADNQLLGITALAGGGLWAVGDGDIPPAVGNQTLTVESADR